jgi:predicted RNA binding protein YcfA (HicA-like mRNA interferase family)
MSTIPSLTSKELIRILLQKGFLLDRSKGSHQIFFNSENHKRVIVPMHTKDLPTGTLMAIIKQAGIDKQELY